MVKKRKLILSLTKKDFKVQTFKSGGPGGQNQNKRETGVRITHRESNAIGEARDSRDQVTNRRNALKRLSESGKFKIWLNKKLWEIELGESIEETVENLMKSENIKVEEMSEDGRWIVNTPETS